MLFSAAQLLLWSCAFSANMLLAASWHQRHNLLSFCLTKEGTLLRIFATLSLSLSSLLKLKDTNNNSK